MPINYYFLITCYNIVHVHANSCITGKDLKKKNISNFIEKQKNDNYYWFGTNFIKKIFYLKPTSNEEPLTA